MAKNIFSGWKKFSSNGKNTIMAHPSGHKMIIQHKHLKPEHLEQLHSLPFAGADSGSLKPTKDDVSGSLKPPKMAEGGAVKKENYSEGFKKEYPGIVYDTESPAGDWDATKRPGAAKQEAPKATPEAEYDPSQDAAINRQPRKKYAEGTPDAPVSAEDAAPVVSADATTPAPDTAEPAPAPAPVDPELQQKRELYNSLVAGNIGAKTGAPDADNAPAKQFGPNGEAPKQFDAGAWTQAEQKFGQAAQAKAQDETQQAAATIEENKARQAAGLTPLPVPAAAMASKQDPALQAQAQASTAPQTPSDPYGTQAYSDAYVKGINEQKAGMAQEAKASQVMGDQQAASLQKGQEVQQAALQNYQTHYQNLENERQGLISDINNQHIDPNHYLNSMGTGSKIATAIGLIAGGFGAGIAHQENGALKFLNSQIDRDINAQKANLGKSENLLSANMRQFGNLRDASDMTRVMQTDIISNQLKMEAAKAQGPMAKARLLQAAGALDQQAAPVLSQIAMRKTLIGAAQSGHIPPSRVIDMIVPEHLKGEAQKQLKEAQDASSLRDNVLSAYDQIMKINTLGNRVGSPYQSMKQISSIKGPVLDKLTKDVSGRVTPETVKLVGGILDTLGGDDKTHAIQRQQLDHLLSQGMHYPILKDYNIPFGVSRFDANGQSRIPEFAPVTK